MYDSGKIITGLVIFAALFTSPVWYDVFNGKSQQRPDLVLPSKVNQKECVAGTEFMRRDHMKLLDDWRYEVVRRGETYYHSDDGKTYEMRFTKTCLGCHPNTSQFCDQCHSYVAVTPYCWDCHNKPRNLSVQ